MPFEKLRGRTVIATGDRRRDLAVRLLHAEVDHVVIADPYSPAAPLPPAARALDVIDNAATYTAFHELRAPSGRQPVSESVIRIASIYPTLLGTYGDGGNVLALKHRAGLHGLATDVVEVSPGEPLPRDCDLYVLGGGEDTAQVAAADSLRADGGLTQTVDRGAAVLAICAGYQLIGQEFPDATARPPRGGHLGHSDRPASQTSRGRTADQA